MDLVTLTIICSRSIVIRDDLLHAASSDIQLEFASRDEYDLQVYDLIMIRRGCR